MNEPIFVLGCHRSGTSLVAGLLHHACGVEMAELMPGTADNPLGYFEPVGAVEAHRRLLFSLERDWTCPPSDFDPTALDLRALEREVETHRKLPGVWAIKDPRLMFLLPAWSHLGVDRVRLIAVARPPADTIRSIEKRDHIPQDRAEAIVDTYLERLAEIAAQVPLPVIRFPGDDDSLIAEVHQVAESLGLPWDETKARELFKDELVRNRSPLRDDSPAYEALLERTQFPAVLSASRLSDLKFAPSDARLPSHLGPRYGLQRHELARFAGFTVDSNESVVELVRAGGRPGNRTQGGLTFTQVEATGPRTAGAAIVRQTVRPDGVIAAGLLTDRPETDVEYFLQSMYASTASFADLVVDVPDPRDGEAGISAPPLPTSPSPDRVVAIAERNGWQLRDRQRLSIGRSGLKFVKSVVVTDESVPLARLIDTLFDRVHAIGTGLETVERRLNALAGEPTRSSNDNEVAELRRRADNAEIELKKLRSRKIVRLALRIVEPIGALRRRLRP